GTFIDTSFKEVSGLSVESSPEEVTEGGLNAYRHKLPTAAKYPNLMLKRGLVANSKLRRWIEKAINDFEFQPTQVTIELLDQFNQKSGSPKALMSWVLHNVWPVKWEATGLDSMSNEVAIESLELAYDYFEIKGSKRK
ncbi:MAG: phage tail protein, partial [Bacteroidota bacterium]